MPGSFFSYLVSECNQWYMGHIWQIFKQSIYIRDEWECKPHGACRVLIPAVIHSDFDHYFSWAEKTANRMCYKHDLISALLAFAALNHNCEIY